MLFKVGYVVLALIVGALIASLHGCADYSSNKNYAPVDNRVDYGSGTVLICNEENCTIDGSVKSEELIQDAEDRGVEVKAGVYPGRDADKATCNAAGFFWCPIEKACLPQPLDGGSCKDRNK